MQKKSVSGRIFDAANLLLMMLIVVVMLYPLIYVFCYSLSDAMQVRGKLLLWPVGFTLNSYISLFQTGEIPHAALVSVARSLAGPVVMMLVTSMAAYALARRDLPGLRFFNRYFVFTMYFSGGLIPVYLTIKNLGLLGSFWVYILPVASNAFYLVLIRTYMQSLPTELEEAALIDGASYWRTYLRVILPVCKPVLAAVALFASVYHWNNFIDTRLYCSMDRDLFPLQYVLYNFLNATQTQSAEQAQAMGAVMDTNPETIKMAITVVAVLPIMCVYPFLQKYFVSGLLIGSIKG